MPRPFYEMRFDRDLFTSDTYPVTLPNHSCKMGYMQMAKRIRRIG